MKARKPGEFLNPPKPEDGLESVYARWQKDPVDTHLITMLDRMKPVIDNAVTTYAGGSKSPLVSGRARVLAARAIRSYDPNAGASLKSHLMLQLQPLRRFHGQASRPLKMSERRLAQLRDLQQAEREYFDKYDRDPSDVELADHLGISIRKISKIRNYARPVMGPSTELTGTEGVIDHAATRTDPMEAWLDYVYNELDSTDQQIVDWKLGRNGRSVLPNNEIGKRLRLTPAAVSQRLARIQQKILAGEGLEI